MGAEPHSAFHIVEGLHPSLSPFIFQAPFSANIDPAKQVKLACHIKWQVVGIIYLNVSQVN